MTAIERIHHLKDRVLKIIEYVSNIEHHDHETLNWKYSKDVWSLLECIEHLNRYNRYYNRELTRVINSTSPGTITNRSSWLGRKFIAMMHPHNRKKQKTMKHLNPIHSILDEPTTIHEFIAHQKMLLVILDSSGSKSIDKQSIGVEFFRLLRMSFLDALEFVIVHEQRHVLQMKAIMQKRSNQEAVLKV